MDPKFLRRDVLKTLGSVAALGATAGVAESAPKSTQAAIESLEAPRVNLICHGMMLLWQDRNNPKAGVTIHLPNTMGTHELRLSMGVGGTPNLIDSSLLEGGGPPPLYRLDFKHTAPSVYSAGVRLLDPRTDVVLYDERPAGRPGHLEPDLRRSATIARIAIPYPTSVRRFRTTAFGPAGPAYLEGDTQREFGVNPTEMANVHVLTYDRVTTPVALSCNGGEPVYLSGKSEPPRLLNLHLYSEMLRRPLPGDANHLHMFNSMLRLNGKVLDLAVNPETERLTSPAPDPEFDLSQLDLYDLFELDLGPSAARLADRGGDPTACVWGAAC
jgi:hypothetical protein